MLTFLLFRVGSALRRADTIVMPKGTCRFCGCTEGKPCRYVPNPHNPIGGQPVLMCEWADKTKTLCNNPLCLERRAAESAGKKTGIARNASNPHENH